MNILDSFSELCNSEYNIIKFKNFDGEYFQDSNNNSFYIEYDFNTKTLRAIHLDGSVGFPYECLPIEDLQKMFKQFN